MINKINNQENYQYTVDIVLPIRDRDEYNVLERLRLREFYNMPSNFNVFVIDYGSKEDIALEIENICRINDYKYYYADTRFNLFNLSHARNIAILNSDADYLIYEDIDLTSHKDFYIWINRQIKSMLIDRNWPFLVIPVAYLSEGYSEHLYQEIDAEIYDSVVSEIFDPDSELIEFFAPASSHIVCSRKMSKLIGGFDESFEGWGFEDSDFELRFLRKANIEKPRDFYKLDTRPYSNQTQWSGWRVLFRIFADIMANKGIYSFHLWHPKPEHRSTAIRNKNHQIFKQNSIRYASAKQELLPLNNSNSPSDLFLNENPHHFNLSVFQFFDNPLLINEDGILLSKIEELVKKNNIRNVVVNNPYGKEKRLHIYNALKESGTKVYVVERGALPNSIYIDPNGFCAESSSYNEENWINNLNDEKIEKTYDYINEYKSNNLSLEPQGSIMGGENLRYKLIGSVRNNKILFVALQSPSDTTTNFFCGDIGSYDNYINEIQKLCYLLKDSDWIVVYKNHPLTINKVNFEDALCVDSYHINDILDACDRVTLINSGVGVLAMIYNKPVYYFGQAFYAIEGLNKKISNADELYLELLDSGFDYSHKKSLAFLSFLINDFYSFASWVRKERKHTDMAKMSISENITYQTLRVDDFECIFDNNPIVDLRHSLLFDRYRTEDYIFRNQVEKKPSSNIKNSSPSNVELITKRVESLDKLDENKLSNKKYNIKTKTRKLINNPNKFFADYFLKKTNK